MSINRVTLLGHLGAAPELRYTPAQHPVCTMRLATTERRKTPVGAWEEYPEWHNVIAWGTTAENCAKYLNKGRELFVEGRIQTHKWQDQEGATRSRTEVIAHVVHFVGSRKSAAPGAGEDKAASDPGPSDGDAPLLADRHAPVLLDADEIPF
jgi:single-strand DNA-binding protein